MTTTFKVKFWEIKRREGRKRPYAVRWLTDKVEHSEWYAAKALAASRLSDLTRAARNGEPFDVESGLPVGELRRRNSLSFLEFAQSYVDLKWSDAAATTRSSTVEALTTAAASFVRDGVGRPEVGELRGVLTRTLLPPTTRDRDVSGSDSEVIDWLRRNSRPLYDLTDAVAVRAVLDALAAKLDGKAAAATVYQRKRAVLFNLLSYAVERELIPDNPLSRIKRKVSKVVDQVDPRVVANPKQVRELLTAVTYVGRRNKERGAHLAAFFAVGYYAAARPAEGLGLREDDCTLPESGWGALALGESRPAAGKRWTDSGRCTTGAGSSIGPKRRFGSCRFRRCWSASCAITSTGTGSGRMGGCSGHPMVALCRPRRTTGSGMTLVSTRSCLLRRPRRWSVGRMTCGTLRSRSG
jgi:hypothetical protein